MFKIIALILPLFATLASQATTSQHTYHATLCAAWDQTFASDGTPNKIMYKSSIEKLNAQQISKVHQANLKIAMKRCTEVSVNPKGCRPVTCVDFIDTYSVESRPSAGPKSNRSSGNATCYALVEIAYIKCEDHFRSSNSLDQWAEAFCKNQAASDSAQCK